MSYHNTFSPPASANFSEGLTSSSQPGGKRRKISTACSACQHRKTKCSGGTPCKACSSRGSPCLYDATFDQRRKVAVHRNLQDLSETRAMLERTQHTLGGFIAILRVGNQNAIDDLLNTIRSGVDTSQIAAHVRNAVRSEADIQTAFDETDLHIDGPQGLPSPTNLMQLESSSRSLPNYASIADGDYLSQPNRRYNPSSENPQGQPGQFLEPPVRVPATPWTTVTDDDFLVSHLISLWFTWMHPWWHWVDKDNFIEAMQNQDISNPLCTACLVNMILADACLLDATAEFVADRTQLRERFYKEGTKYLANITERPASMNMVAALGVQWTYLNTIGEDKSGLKVLNDQVEKAEELNSWRQNVRLPPSMLRKVDISLDRLAWTLFALKGLSLMSLQQMVPPDKPIRPKPVRDCIKDQRHDHNPNQPWTLYPAMTGRIFHYECHYSCYLSLAETVCQDEGLLRGTGVENEDTNERFSASFQKLRSWPTTLPDCMQLTEQSTPHVLALHTIHLWALINIAKQANAAEKGRLSHPGLIDPSAYDGGQWAAAAYESAINISELLMTHSWLWGVQHFPVILLQPVSLSLFVLLGDLGRPANAKAFTNLCFWAHSMSTRLQVANGILDLVESKAHELRVELPKETQEYFSVRRTKKAEASDVDLAYLLGKWDDFTLNSVDQQISARQGL